MKKYGINFYAVSRELSENVGSYMYKNVWKVTVDLEHQAKMLELENTMKGIENLSLTEEEKEVQRKSISEKMEAQKEAHSKRVEAEARYTFSQSDKDLYKAYQNATTEAMVWVAIEKWLQKYDVRTDKASELIRDLLKAVSGERALTGKQLAKQALAEGAEGMVTNFTGKRTQSDFLKVFYSCLANILVEAGTLKGVLVPEATLKALAPKSRKKKEETKADVEVKVSVEDVNKVA